MSSGIYGLIGGKLGHSLSPEIHRLLGRSDYRLFELTPGELPAFLSRGDIGGLNVTIPYKTEAMKYCSPSPLAAEIGAVNTLVARDGRLFGYNTDPYGFLYLAERAGISFAGRKTVILGSGGASKTVAYCAKTQGAREIAVISRSGEDNYSNPAKHADADILVNCTPVGMYPDCGVSPVDISVFPALSAVIDLIYNPRLTKLLSDAKERGIKTAGGLCMLVAQAKRSAELFSGEKIPDGEIERTIRAVSLSSSNIVLIGMPGGGKTAVGRALAKMTGRALIDTDEEIERLDGRPAGLIIEEEGEEAFRRLETAAVRAAGSRIGVIIATGGGVVTRPENKLPLRQNGRVYEIRRPTGELETAGRPLSAGPGGPGKLLAERAALYESFRDALIMNNGTPEEAAERIWRDLCENTCD